MCEACEEKVGLPSIIWLKGIKRKDQHKHLSHTHTHAHTTTHTTLAHTARCARDGKEYAQCSRALALVRRKQQRKAATVARNTHKHTYTHEHLAHTHLPRSAPWPPTSPLYALFQMAPKKGATKVVEEFTGYGPKNVA